MSQAKILARPQRRAVGDAGRFGRLEQRGVDRRRRRANARLHRVVDHPGREALVLAYDFQRLGLADLAGQLLDRAIAVRQPDRLSRPEEIDALADAGQVADRREVDLSSAMRRKIRSSVSLRPTTTSIVATARPACWTWTGRAAAAKLEAALVGGTGCGVLEASA